MHESHALANQFNNAFFLMLSYMLDVEDIEDSDAFQIVQDVYMSSVKDAT